MLPGLLTVGNCNIWATCTICCGDTRGEEEIRVTCSHVSSRQLARLWLFIHILTFIEKKCGLFIMSALLESAYLLSHLRQWSQMHPPKKMLNATAVSLKCQDGSSFRSIINQACWFPAAVQVRVVSRLLKLVRLLSETRSRKKDYGEFFKPAEVESIGCWFYQWTCNQAACLFLNKWISPFFFPELLWIHKSEAVFQKHSNSEAHLMHPQLTSTLSSL